MVGGGDGLKPLYTWVSHHCEDLFVKVAVYKLVHSNQHGVLKSIENPTTTSTAPYLTQKKHGKLDTGQVMAQGPQHVCRPPHSAAEGSALRHVLSAGGWPAG